MLYVCGMDHYKNLSIKDIDNEIWLDCVGYDGIYSVSNMGRIKSEQREMKCGKGWVNKPAKILKQQVVKSNPKNTRFESKSLKITFSIDGHQKTYSISKLVGMAFLGDIKEGECYSKKNKLWDDCRAINLEIKTFSESIKGAYKKHFCDRYKKTLKIGHKPTFIFKRLIDNKEFVGGNGLKEEYGYNIHKGVRTSLKTGGLCKGSRWEMIPINNEAIEK